MSPPRGAFDPEDLVRIGLSILTPLLCTACVVDSSLTGIGDKAEEGGQDGDSGVLDSGGGGDDDTGGGSGGSGNQGDDGPDARTSGTELWLAYMENLTLAFNGEPDFTVVIEASEGAEGTIEVPATGYSQEFSVEAGAVEEIALPDAIWYAEGSETVGNGGIRISADRDIEAVGVHYRIYFSEAARLLPTQELGDAYRVLAVPDALESSPSEFVVVATEDGTEVEIVPSVFTYGLRPADTAYTVELDAGETWQVQADGDLSGSTVRSLGGQRLAVFTGAREAYAGCGDAANSHVYDQLLPLKRWGRHTVLPPAEPKGFDVVRILADEDGTEVRLDCGEPVLLDAGEVYEERVAGGVSVTSSAPVLVAQVFESGGCDGDADAGPGSMALGDPNLVVLPPAALTRSRGQFRTLSGISTLESASQHVSLWSPEGGAVQLDGSEVSGSVEVSTGAHVLEAEQPWQGIAYGLAEYDAWSTSLGYDCEGCVDELEVAPECD